MSGILEKMIKRCYKVSENLSSYKKIQEWGKEKALVELPLPNYADVPIWELYHEYKNLYTVLKSLLQLRGYQIYTKHREGKEPTLDEVLAGEKVVFYKEDYDEDIRLIKLTLGFCLMIIYVRIRGKEGLHEKRYLGFRLKIETQTIDKNLNEEEKEKVMDEILRWEKPEINEMEAEENAEAVREVIESVAVEEIEEKETFCGYDRVEKYKIARDKGLTLKKIMEETGLDEIDVIKGIGYLLTKMPITLALTGNGPLLRIHNGEVVVWVSTELREGDHVTFMQQALRGNRVMRLSIDLSKIDLDNINFEGLDV